MHCNNEISDNNLSIEKMFSSYFSSIYTAYCNIYNILSNLLNSIDNNYFSLSLSESFEGLAQLKLDPTYGPDCIPSLFLNKFCYSLAYPIYKLFSLTLKSGVFPSFWKSSFVTPIWKSEDKSDVTNYKPISKLNTPPKPYEKLIEPKLSDTLKHTLINEQHGFRQKKSTDTNLLMFFNYLSNMVGNGEQVDVIYTDIRKAFDIVNHSIFINKLIQFGFGQPVLSWLSSYLTDRFQIVKINNKMSDKFNALSGVPQGGHLSPLLFLIFINDIFPIFKFSQFLLFADNLKLYMNIHSVNDINHLRSDLDRLAHWCSINGLNLNNFKCTFI
jgi:hypothetical protein